MLQEVIQRDESDDEEHTNYVRNKDKRWTEVWTLLYVSTLYVTDENLNKGFHTGQKISRHFIFSRDSFRQNHWLAKIKSRANKW